MDTTNVPRTFWHALSFCMVVATVGLITIAYRASDVSIEIANAKVSLSSALTDVKDIKGELERENERLRKVNEDLQAKVALLDKAKVGSGGKSVFDSDMAAIFGKSAGSGAGIAIKPPEAKAGAKQAEIKTAEPPLLDPKRFEQIDRKIQQVEKFVVPQ